MSSYRQRAFVIVVAILLAVGACIGRALAAHPNLEPFKLLNIVGLTYDLLGLVVLSEAVAGSARWKSVVVRWLAGVILWGQTVIPLGAAIGAWSTNFASSSVASHFFFLFWAWSIMPLAFLDAKVYYPRVTVDHGMDVRVKRLGVGLLFAGVLVQLLAGYFDLYA